MLGLFTFSYGDYVTSFCLILETEALFLRCCAVLHPPTPTVFPLLSQPAFVICFLVALPLHKKNWNLDKQLSFISLKL